jgi:four helix bundle protein
MPFAVENLTVYQKSVDFADAILATTEHFPRGYGFLADQLNRASVSIAANLAEGNGRFTKADQRNFFTIARGSVQECVPLLELACRHDLIARVDHESLRSGLQELARMIASLINTDSTSERDDPRNVTSLRRGHDIPGGLDQPSSASSADTSHFDVRPASPPRCPRAIVVPLAMPAAACARR